MLNEFLNPVLQALLSFSAALVVAALVELRKHVLAWFAARTTAAQRETLHRLASEGFALAEQLYRDAGGPEKLRQALAYVERAASERNIKVEAATIRATVEHAVLQYNALTKEAKQNGNGDH